MTPPKKVVQGIFSRSHIFLPSRCTQAHARAHTHTHTHTHPFLKATCQVPRCCSAWCSFL